jgi:hypothetical protein
MEDIKLNATAELRKIPKEAFRWCFQQWQDLWSKCVCVCVCVFVCVCVCFLGKVTKKSRQTSPIFCFLYMQIS